MLIDRADVKNVSRIKISEPQAGGQLAKGRIVPSHTKIFLTDISSQVCENRFITIHCK